MFLNSGINSPALSNGKLESWQQRSHHILRIANELADLDLPSRQLLVDALSRVNGVFLQTDVIVHLVDLDVLADVGVLEVGAHLLKGLVVLDALLFQLLLALHAGQSEVFARLDPALFDLEDLVFVLRGVVLTLQLLDVADFHDLGAILLGCLTDFDFGLESGLSHSFTSSEAYLLSLEVGSQPELCLQILKEGAGANPDIFQVHGLEPDPPAVQLRLELPSHPLLEFDPLPKHLLERTISHLIPDNTLTDGPDAVVGVSSTVHILIAVEGSLPFPVYGPKGHPLDLHAQHLPRDVLG
jgi:hypothetical protein